MTWARFFVLEQAIERARRRRHFGRSSIAMHGDRLRKIFAAIAATRARLVAVLARSAEVRP